jgi:bla regulator protein BlaR1
VNRITEHLMNIFDWVWSVSAMAAVTVVLILLMQRVLNKRLKPRWHYLMWLLVIVRLVLPWSPESEFSIYNWISYADSVHTITSVSHEEMASAAVMSDSTVVIVYRYLFYIWLLGVSLLGAYTFYINRKFALNMANETSPITDPKVLQLFSQSQTMMSVQKPVALVRSGQLAVPTLFGFIKPRLIIPQALLNSLNEDQLQHIFLHELAHCKRNDIGINWLMQVMLIIHWFNPVLWYAYHRMRDDQEIACDALALSYLTQDQSQNYGYTLIQLLENYSQPVRVPGNANLSGSKSQLQRRIKMIKQFKSNSYRCWSFVGLAAIIIISGCSLTNAKVAQPTEQKSNTTALEQKAASTDETVTTFPTASEETTNSPDAVVPNTAASEEKTIPAASNESTPIIKEEGSMLAVPAASSTPPSPERPRPAATTQPSVTPSPERMKPTAAALNEGVAPAAPEAPTSTPPQERSKPTASTNN